MSGETPQRDTEVDEPARVTLPLSLVPDGRAAAAGEQLSLGPGSVLKQYELIRELGRGGMGRVFLARDTRLARLCAIKLLLGYSGERAERFLSEARATARCKHESIVVIYEVDEHRGFPYMVLEYVEGRTLRAWLEERGGDEPPPARAVAEMMIPVVQALVCAHEMEIVHRDLKPENIALTEAGQTKVLDFGVAKHMAVDTTGEHPTGRSLVGTPAYMSPEQWLDLDVDAQTDLWAVGVMLHELATGRHPLAPAGAAQLAAVCELDEPMPLRTREGALHGVVARCLCKRKAGRFASARELLAALEAVAAEVSAPSGDHNPFAGLSAFQEQDVAQFFGRERDTAAVVGRLRQHQLVVVAGPSGAGKSSLVRAGVIPTLKRAGGRWEAFIVRPGRRPLAALADLVAAFAPDPAQDLVAALHSEPGLFGARLRARCRADDRRALLFVDQFEELYTLTASAQERASFLACLEGAADEASSPVRVVLAIRSDFLDRIADDRRFSAEVTRGLVLLSPIGREGLRRALVRPIELAGYRFEDDGLVDEMLDMLERTRSPLPLLQFTATLLWEARDGARRLISRASHDALGGVAGALSTHADAVLMTLSAREQRLARSILLRLVAPERTRAIVPLAELRGLSDGDDAAAQVVQRLADARLLQIESGDGREGSTVELVHESLIDRWTRLRGWLDANEHDAQFLARLRAAAQQWRASDRAPGLLWREHAAEEGRAWVRARDAEDAGQGASRVALAAHEQQYLAAVVELLDRAQRRRRRRVVAALSVLTIIAFVVSYLALRAEQEADRAREQSHLAAAQAARADGEARQARNATRMAAARELQVRDPTTALALLRELELPELPREWADLAAQALGGGLHELALEHPERVHTAVYSPDGRRIVSASEDAIVRVWDADGRGEPRLLRGHEGPVYQAAWSPDGRRIVSASADHSVRVWDVDGDAPPLELRGHAGVVRAASFRPDGRQVASASSDGTLRIWRADDGVVSAILRGHTGPVRWVAWSPDGASLVSAGEDHSVRVWPVDGGAPVVLRGHTSAVYMAAWSPDGRHIVTCSNDHTARVWRADGTGTPVVRGDHDAPVFTAAWSPDGSRIVTGSYDATMAVWRADGTGAPLVLRGHAGAVRSVAWSGDGRRILAASWDRTVRRWVTPSQGEPRVFTGEDDAPLFSGSWRPDGLQIVTAHADAARVWSVADGRVVAVLRGHEREVYGAEWSPDGRWIATASFDATLRIWGSGGGGEPRVLRGHEDGLLSVAWSPDGRHITTGSGDATARIWDVDGGGEPRVLRGHAGPVNVAAWSPDGRRILTGSLDKTARIWDLEGGGEPRVLAGHHESVLWVAWRPDGRQVVTVSEDTLVRLWDVDGDAPPRVLHGHAGGVLRAMWSPDGQRLATSSKDKTVRIWSAGADDPQVLRGHTSEVYTVRWSPDGRRLATASMDGTLRIWSDLEPLLGVDDPRLWAASRHCIGVERRVELLSVPRALAEADDAACRLRAARAAGDLSPGPGEG